MLRITLNGLLLCDQPTVIEGALFMAFIGMDLGTTNSLVAVFRDGASELIPNQHGEFLTPSVVSNYDGAMITGRGAKSRLVSHPNETAAIFKRTMGAAKTYKLGKQRFKSEELSAIVLRSLKSDAEAFLNAPVSDVVISVPAYFNEQQRKSVRAAGKLAGLNVQRLINEPTAAALAYGLNDIDGESTFLAFDLGGGTFDVSIIEMFEGVMEVRATAGDAYLGGEDFTKAIAKHFQAESGIQTPTAVQMGALTDLAERAKVALSQKHDVTLNGNLDGTEFSTTFTRDDFEKVCDGLLIRLRRPVDRALHDAKLSRSEIERVVLVGGATRMPMVRSFAGKHLGRLPEMSLNPDHVVALGAAIQAGLVGNDAALDDVVMTDVSAFTLGTDISRDVGNSIQSGFYEPIIERNSVVPISREQVFSTAMKGQTEVEFNIYQGESPMVSGNLFLGKLTVKVPKNKKEHEAVSIRFSYDVSGLLEVDAKVLSTGAESSLLITSLSGEMDDAEIAKRLKNLDGLKVHPKDISENILLRARIEQCYAMALADDRDILQRMLVEFDTVIAKQNHSDIAVLCKDFSEQLDAYEAHYVT